MARPVLVCLNGTPGSLNREWRSLVSLEFGGDSEMDPSVFATGSIVLNKVAAALNIASSGSNSIPGYSNGGFTTPDGRGRVDPINRYLQLNWALPTGSPADFPMVLDYHSNAGGATEFGTNWSAPYHRSAEQAAGGVNILTPLGVVSYTNPDANNNYVGSPNPLNNTLNGSATIGWTETQPDGTTFHYDTSGFLRTIRNNAGVRWTLTWNSGFTFVQHIDGPLGRRTSLTYDSSNNIRRIQDASGRITSLTVNTNNDLVRVVTPQLCTTSLVYNSHELTAWINPLGNRTTYLYDSTSTTSVKTIIQPLGQRTSFLSYSSPAATVVVYPTLGRTTISSGIGGVTPALTHHSTRSAIEQPTHLSLRFLPSSLTT